MQPHQNEQTKTGKYVGIGLLCACVLTIGVSMQEEASTFMGQSTKFSQEIPNDFDFDKFGISVQTSARLPCDDCQFSFNIQMCGTAADPPTIIIYQDAGHANYDGTEQITLTYPDDLDFEMNNPNNNKPQPYTYSMKKYYYTHSKSCQTYGSCGTCKAIQIIVGGKQMFDDGGIACAYNDWAWSSHRNPDPTLILTSLSQTPTLGFNIAPTGTPTSPAPPGAQKAWYGKALRGKSDGTMGQGCDAPPTAQPTAHPSTQPTQEPTAQPTAEPTAQPTSEPTSEPTREAIENKIYKEYSSSTTLVEFKARRDKYLGEKGVNGCPQDTQPIHKHNECREQAANLGFSYYAKQSHSAHNWTVCNYCSGCGGAIEDGGPTARVDISHASRAYWICK